MPSSVPHAPHRTLSKNLASDSLIQDVIPEDPLTPDQPLSGDFDIYTAFQRNLRNEQISVPVAAILALTELIETSTAGTMFELVKALGDGAQHLQKRVANPISLNAGCELFLAFVTHFPHKSESFSELRTELVQQGKSYAQEALTYREKIARLSLGFIKDDSVILTHSYSRVVMQALLLAHRQKRISVYVTESRPRGMGIKTHEALTAAGIPCTVILDSAVAYAMDKVDFVLMGSEAVVESGGLVNEVGSAQIALVAHAANKPFYALAESYKFHRLFPLSQYDLPTHTPRILSFLRTTQRPGLESMARPSVAHFSNEASPPTTSPHSNSRLVPRSTSSTQRTMSSEQIALNPEVDYTRPYLISLVFSDVGILTPEGVSQYLVGMFAG